MNRSPVNYPNSGIPQVQGWPQNLMPPRFQGFPSGSNRSDTDAEMLLSSAVAWWDASQYKDGDRFLRNLGTAGELLDARLGSSDRVATTNDPLFLSAENNDYVYIPNVTGNLIYVGANVLPSLSTWDFAIRVAVDQLNVGYPLGGIDSTHAYLALQNDRTLWIRFLNTSIANIGGVSSTVAVPGITAGVPIWLRGRVTISTAVCEYWYSHDQTNNESEVNWIQLGTPVTGSNAGTSPFLTFSNGAVWGSYSGGLSGMAGKFYAGVERVDGVVRQEIRASSIPNASSTSFTITTGQSASIGRATSGRKCVVMPSRWRGGRSCFLFGTDDYMEVIDNQQHRLLNFFENESMTVVAITRHWGHGTNYSSTIVSKGRNLFQFYGQGWYLAVDGSTNVYYYFSTNVTQEDSTTLPTVAMGSGNFVRGALQVASLVYDKNSFRATLRSNSLTNSASIPQSLPRYATNSNNRFRFGADSSLQGYGDFELVAAAVFRRALTPAEIATIVRYYGAA